MKLYFIVILIFFSTTSLVFGQEKPRIIIETDIGGDPDDQATLVRFLLYANEFDTEGIILTTSKDRYRNRFNIPNAPDSYQMVRRYLDGYGEVVNNLNLHVPTGRKYPSKSYLESVTKWSHTASGGTSNAGVNLIISALKKNDSRPIWFTNWGTSDGINPSSLKIALDRIKRGTENISYAAAVQKIKFIEYENLNNIGSLIGGHLSEVNFAMDTFTPTTKPNRWADRWPRLTGEGCEESDNTDNGCTREDWPYLNNIYKNYGIFLAKYYTIQKEGDTMTWMHLLENGINVVGSPELGSWSGRYTQKPGKEFWKCHEDNNDSWNGTNKRDNALLRWGNSVNKATDIINDFKVRWQWALQSRYTRANHHPRPVINRNSGLKPIRQSVDPGDKIKLSAVGSSDPDGNGMRYQWVVYNEISLPGASLTASSGKETEITIPDNPTEEIGYVHAYLRITDNAPIPLTRYKRVIFEVSSKPPPRITLRDSVNAIIPASQFLQLEESNYTVHADVVWEYGQINKVEFFNNGVKVSTHTTAPYTFDINRRIEGNYKIFVRVHYEYEGESKIKNSNTIEIFVADRLINQVSTTGDKVYKAMRNFGKVKPYTDYAATITEFPSYLAGSEYVMTPNRDRGSSNGRLLTVNLLVSAEVYIAYDRRLSAFPYRGYTDTREHIRTSDGSIMRLYKKKYNAGNIVIGGANVGDSGANNYFVIVKSLPIQVGITSPVNGARYATGTNLPIQANAFGSFPIKHVEFITTYDGTTSSGRDATFPFIYTLNNIKPGVYKIKAKVWYYDKGVLKHRYSATHTIYGTQALIKGVSTTGDKVYRKMLSFGNNVNLYTDATYKVTQHPAFLTGAEYIMTPNRDRGSSNGRLLTANLSAAADVYVAFDRRITTLPSWIRGYYTDTREHVRTNGGAIMRVYKKRVNAGNVVFGGAIAQSGATSNYIVIIKSVPPQIVITSIANGQTFQVGNNILIHTNPSASLPIKKVEFFDNGVKIAEDATAPYAFTLRGLTIGSHKIRVRMQYGYPGQLQNVWSSIITIQGTNLMINSVSTTGNKVYRKMNGFGNNVKLYTDANFKVTQHPSFLTGSEYIMTPNRDRGSSNGRILTANLSVAADVYVAFDRRITTLPSWIRGYYTDTREHVRTNGGAIMRVYKKRVSAGNVVFGAAVAQNANTSNYIVIVTRAGSRSALGGNSNSSIGKSDSVVSSLDSTNNTKDVDFKPYPVPTTDQVFINISEEKPWTLINIQGRVILEGKGSAVDLTEFTDGMYFIQTDTKTYKVFKKSM